MSAVYPTAVGLTSSSHLHDPENLGYPTLQRLVIYRIIELLRRDDNYDITEEFESDNGSSNVDGADGAFNQGDQNAAPHTPSSPRTYEEKVKRLVDAIMDGRRLRFSPSADNDGYTVWAMGNPRSQQVGDENGAEEAVTSENGVEQQISAHPENFGHVIATFRHTVTPNPTGSVPGSESGSAAPSAHPEDLGHVITSTGRLKTPYPSGAADRESSPDENVTPYQAEYASNGSSPNDKEKFQSILKWTADVQSAVAAREASSKDGRQYVYMGQGGIEYDEIDPIPFNIHKEARTIPGTPVISSHGSILVCSSPSFAKTCKGLIKQSYLDIAPSLVPDITAPRSLNEDKGRAGGPNLPDLGSDPGNPGSPGNPEDLGVWEDIEDDDVNDEDDEHVTPTVDALRDTTNLRRPGYLQYNSFYQDAIAKAETAVTTDAGGPVPTTQQEPLFTPNDSAAGSATSVFTTHENIHDGFNFVAAYDALDGVVITDSPDQQASSSLVPRRLELSRSAHIQNALAALEGRLNFPANTPSPIQRFVQPEGYYNIGVGVENLGPGLHHPRPIRSFDGGVVLARMEERVVGGIGLRGGFSEGRLIKRPSNPTPVRARYQNDDGIGGGRVLPAGRLARTSANPTPLRARYQQGEASSA